MTREDWLGTPMCQDGWKPLLLELDGRLKARWPDYTIQQVKEKFGTLRFYAQPAVAAPRDDDPESYEQWKAELDEFHAIVDEYETRSAHVCEACGRPGEIGDRNFWWAVRCPDCAPDGWVPESSQCAHPDIADDRCSSCGRQRIARLEHSDEVLVGIHQAGSCRSRHCTIHNRTDHPLRGFPQRWSADLAIMERICAHGIGHPDPDECAEAANGPQAPVHGCDGCCAGLPSQATIPSS